jgi:hypothetical protein
LSAFLLCFGVLDILLRESSGEQAWRNRQMQAVLVLHCLVFSGVDLRDRYFTLPPRLHQYLKVLRVRRSAISGQFAPLQRFRLGHLQTRNAQHGEVAADLRKLFLGIRLLGRVVGPLRHLFAMITQGKMGVNPRDLPVEHESWFLGDSAIFALSAKNPDQADQY